MMDTDIEVADVLNSQQGKLELSVTRTWGNRTLPVKSPEWRALRAQIISEKKATCASCGYISPHPFGKGLKIDHKDGNASNNNLDNLRVHCPPCEAIRHCGFAGIEGWIVLVHSDMEQVDILRRTRNLFEREKSIPHVREVDSNATRSRMETTALANKLMESDRRDLTEEEKHLKAFFTGNARDLFTVTMIVEPESWVVFSPETHSNLRNFFGMWSPSKAHSSQVTWISVRNPKLPAPGDRDGPDFRALQREWATVCTNHQPTTDDLAHLASRFDVLTGKWMIFSRSDEIDAIWSRIANSTYAGNLGIAAKVSPRNDEESSHLICVHTRDFSDRDDVDRVRDGLRRLGVKWKIGYKADIYTHCDVYKDNPWNIRPTLYYS